MPKNIVTEAIADAKLLEETTTKRAQQMFLKEFSPKIKSMLHEVINKEVSSGIEGGTNINKNTGDGPTDQDGGFTPGKDVKEDTLGMDTQDDDELNQDEPEISETGDEPNPEDIPSDDEFELDEENPTQDDEFELDEENPTQDDELEPDGDEDSMIEGDTPSDDELNLGNYSDDEVIEVVDGDDEFSDDSDDEKETPIYEQKYKSLRKKAKSLYTENKQLKRAVSILNEKFGKLNLFNAKLAYAFKLMHQPGITRSEKKQIAETFDKAKSVREAQLIYNTMKQAFSSKVSTGNKNLLKTNNVRSVLSESTKIMTEQNSRLNELAGL